MEYKGYTAAVEFDPELDVFTGHVIDLRDELYFEGHSVDELRAAFHESVDDYLAFCEEKGREPSKPYSGKIMLRTEPAVHRAVVRAATRAGKSMNEWAESALAEAAGVAGRAPAKRRVTTRRSENRGRRKPG